MIERHTNYQPRFRGYYMVKALVKLADACVDLAVAPFGYESVLYYRFCEWDLWQDVKRSRARRAA